MKEYKSTKEMLDAFQEAWSTQNIEDIIAFFAKDLTFEDIPIGLHASNKEELRGVLEETFKGVPNFNMEILECHEGKGFVVTKWKQTGNMSVKGYGLDLNNFAYETITTSIIQLDENGLITSVSDNWNTSMFYQ